MKITTTTYPSGKIYRYCVDGRTVLKSDVQRLACTTDEIVEIDYAVAQKFPRIAKPTDEMKVIFTDEQGRQKYMTKAAAVQIGAKIGRLQSRNVYYVETVNETKADETVAEIDGCDETAFDLLPTVDELNDCRSDIEKEFDEFAAEDTDRDARFNHGERHTAKLEKQLRELDPTVEVTYGIDTDGEDVFYLRFGKYVYRTPFGTIRAVESTFYLWRHDQLVDELNEIGDDIIDTREILERKVVEGASQAELKNIAEYIADRNREYADLYKAAYGEEPVAGDIDLDADKILNRAMTEKMTDIDRAAWEYLQRRGHKHYWQVGKGKYGETTVYFVADDGEIEYAESDPDWRREAEEQLDMVYSERDFCWYDKDDERADPYYDQSYGRDDILSDYYNDLL